MSREREIKRLKGDGSGIFDGESFINRKGGVK